MYRILLCLFTWPCMHRGHHVSAHILYNSNRPEQSQQQLLQINMASCRGIIVNRSPKKMMSVRHWYTILRHPSTGLYWNVDSKLPEPAVIGEHDSLMVFLLEELQSADAQIFFCSSDDSTAIMETDTIGQSDNAVTGHERTPTDATNAMNSTLYLDAVDTESESMQQS